MDLLSPDHPDRPKYWWHEAGSELIPAMETYLNGGRLTRDQIHLIKAYLKQWVDSPAWKDGDDLTVIRRHVAEIETQEEIEASIRHIAMMGMYPL